MGFNSGNSVLSNFSRKSRPSAEGGAAGDPRSTTSSTTHTESPIMAKRAARMRRVSNSRILFLVCLTAMAALLGMGTYRLLKDSEERLAREQFQSISDRALDMSVEIAQRKKQGLITLASIAEQAFPDVETWPYIEMKGFEVFASNLVETASRDPMVLRLTPIVYPEDLTSFETFAANLYPETGVTRVQGLDPTFQLYNETDGEVWWGSPYKYFAPFMYSSTGVSLYIRNYHSIEARGKELDVVLACSHERAKEMQENEDNSTYVPKECSLVTEIISLSGAVGPDFVPSSVIIHPVYPANNQSILVGFITSAMKWHETLINVFSSEVSGVDCVLATETQAYTYEVKNGVATLKGAGDLHDRDFSHYGRTIALSPPGRYSESSSEYTLTVYPTHELFDVYATRNPVAATVGAVCIVVLTACIFFLYDFVVRKEFSHKDALDSARRQFVRFISHEVRTPLNAVCMGLQLQQDESNMLMELLRHKKDDDDDVNNNKNDNDSGSPSSPTTVLPPSSEGGEEQAGDPVQDRVTELTSLGNDILSNATSAVDVLNDLLNYDKVESGTLSLELTIIKIWELIEHTFSEFHQQANFNDVNYILDLSAFQENNNDDTGADVEKPITLASELPQDIRNRKVIGDKVRLTQVMRNLISNALKFSKDKDTLTIRPSWKKNIHTTKEKEITLQSGEKVTHLPCGNLQVEVKDTGHGMTKEQLNSLFREGVQFNVNELQAGQGSGLGLYIAKGILEQHGGSLGAASEGIGCGTVFTMTVPLYFVPDPPETEHAQVQPRRRPDQIEKVEPLHVLVVDDSNMNRKLLARLLNNQGHTTNQAEDGAVAVKGVKEHMDAGNRYDVILMDYEMPVKDGPTAAKEMRDLGCDAFIVGVTGNLFPEDVSHFCNCGANLVLPKPLDIRVLMDAFMEQGISHSL